MQALLLVATMLAQPADSVQVHLVPSHQVAQPNSKILMGLHMELEPEWHTYWINPGDYGMPVKIDWVLPKGFTAGPLLNPLPSRIESADTITYGFEGAPFFATEISIPSNAKGKIKGSANISWMVCKELCMVGRKTLNFELKIGAKPVLDESHTKMFDDLMKSQPKQLESKLVTARRTESGVEISVKLQDMGFESARSAEFFPTDAEVLDNRTLSTVWNKESQIATVFAKPSEFRKEPIDKVRGVLVINGKGLKIDAVVR